MNAQTRKQLESVQTLGRSALFTDLKGLAAHFEVPILVVKIVEDRHLTAGVVTVRTLREIHDWMGEKRVSFDDLDAVFGEKGGAA